MNDNGKQINGIRFYVGKRMEKIKEVLKIILPFIFGAALSYIIKLFNGIEQFVFILCVIVIIILLVIIALQKYKESKNVRFALIIFLLNEKDELLLTFNHTHKILLPPCKTMKTYEMPHQAVERILKDQVGLEKDAYEIDTRFHKNTGNFYRVLDCPAPYAAQQEFSTKQSKRIRFHYSLIYVYKLKAGIEIDETTDFFPRFFSMLQIGEIEENIKPFQDIIMRYKEIMSVLRKDTIDKNMNLKGE